MGRRPRHRHRRAHRRADQVEGLRAEGPHDRGELLELERQRWRPRGRRRQSASGPVVTHESTPLRQRLVVRPLRRQLPAQLQMGEPTHHVDQRSTRADRGERHDGAVSRHHPTDPLLHGAIVAPHASLALHRRRATLGPMTDPRSGRMARDFGRLAGTWTGSNGFRLMPTDDLYDAPATAALSTAAGGHDLVVSYTWAHPVDGPQDGVLVVGSPEDEQKVVTAAWGDS